MRNAAFKFPNKKLAIELSTNPWFTGRIGKTLAGCIVMTGSIPDKVDDILDRCTDPLFQRVHQKITILQFNTFEICRMFKHLYGGKKLTGEFVLALFSLFGGRSHLYKQAWRSGLISDPENFDRKLLVDALITKEYQGSNLDGYNRLELSEGMERALEVIAKCEGQEKKSQISEVKSKLGCSMDEAKIVLSRLHTQYALIQPIQNWDDLSRTETFVLSDVAVKTARMLSRFVTRREEDVSRSIEDFDSELNRLEGQHFKVLVRRILEDTPIKWRILPHADFDATIDCKCYVLPRVKWGKVPSRNRCSRFRSKPENAFSRVVQKNWR